MKKKNNFSSSFLFYSNIEIKRTEYSCSGIKSDFNKKIFLL